MLLSLSFSITVLLLICCFINYWCKNSFHCFYCFLVSFLSLELSNSWKRDSRIYLPALSLCFLFVWCCIKVVVVLVFQEKTPRPFIQLLIQTILIIIASLRIICMEMFWNLAINESLQEVKCPISPSPETTRKISLFQVSVPRGEWEEVKKKSVCFKYSPVFKYSYFWHIILFGSWLFVFYYQKFTPSARWFELENRRSWPSLAIYDAKRRSLAWIVISGNFH